MPSGRGLQLCHQSQAQTFTASGGSGNIIFWLTRAVPAGSQQRILDHNTSGTAGIGNGGVSFSVAPNSTEQGRQWNNNYCRTSIPC